MLIRGGNVRVISTHFGADNVFAELCEEIRAGKLPYSLHQYSFEQAVAEGLYRNILAGQGRADEWSPEAEEAWVESIRAHYGDGASQELDCVPSATSGAYFPRALLKQAMTRPAPVLEYRQTDEFTYESEAVRERVTTEWIAEHLEPVLAAAREAAAGRRRHGYLGMDIARSGDLSVIAVAVETAELNVETVVQIEMRNMPFSEQQRILHYVIDHMPHFCGASIDSRGNGQMLAEQAAQKEGPDYVHEVMLSRKIYADYFARYKQLLEDTCYALPKGGGTMDDHRTVVLDKGVPIIRDHTGPADEKRHGDAAIAHMLVVHAIESDDDAAAYHPYGYEPVTVTATAEPGGDAEDDGWEELI